MTTQSRGFLCEGRKLVGLFVLWNALGCALARNPEWWKSISHLACPRRPRIRPLGRCVAHALKRADTCIEQLSPCGEHPALEKNFESMVL